MIYLYALNSMRSPSWHTTQCQANKNYAKHGIVFGRIATFGDIEVPVSSRKTNTFAKKRRY